MRTGRVGDDRVIAALKRACKAAGGQRAWADQHKIADTAVTMTLRGSRPVSERVANALGFDLAFVKRRTKTR